MSEAKAGVVCGAIFDRKGELLFIDKSTSEADAWRVWLGWPGYDEIEDAKKRGQRFALVYVMEAKVHAG